MSSLPISAPEDPVIAAEHIAELLVLQERAEARRAAQNQAKQAASHEKCQGLAQEIVIYGATGCLTRYQKHSGFFRAQKVWSLDGEILVDQSGQVRIRRPISPHKFAFGVVLGAALLLSGGALQNPYVGFFGLYLALVSAIGGAVFAEQLGFAKVLNPEKSPEVPSWVLTSLENLKLAALSNIAASKALLSQPD